MHAPHGSAPAVASASLPTAALTRALDRAGPYAPLLHFLVWGLCGLTVSRVGLMAWQWERVDAAGHALPMLLMGLRCDLMLLGTWVAPAALLIPLAALVRCATLGRRVVVVWLAAGLILAGFMELATPTFITEYDSRPNRLFVEYLAYPREVAAMLADGFAAQSLAVLLGLAALAVPVVRKFVPAGRRGPSWTFLRTLMLWPLVALLLFAMIRSSTQHRPANLATFARFDDGLVNSLMTNSLYSVLSAAYAFRHESRSSEIYGRMETDELVRRVRAAMAVAPADFVSDTFPTLHRQLASVRRERPLNLVIVLEESLGAGFVGRLGGRGVTPNLDRLAADGIWFEQLYATGTRSVRGIEAVVAGFPPTPAQSTVKLSKAQRGFATLASLLRQQGYVSEFVYGGESHFDNMRGYFLGNGFHRVIDRDDYADPVFVGDWGASDEDLFNKTDERLSALHAAGQPFFVLSFSSSNHVPFQFPDGRITLADAEKQTVNNAVKYADYALGRFIDTARTRDYWRDTLFLVVADHDVRVYGDAIVPVDKFHIPGLILGADTVPRAVQSTASQIDLAPTVLSLMGVDSTHPFPGRDLTRSLPEFGAAPGTAPAPRALMQFNDVFAWLEHGTLTVLQPESQRGQTRAQRYAYDPRDASLRPLAEPDADAARQVLAQSLLPAWLYEQERYRLPDATP